MKKKDLPVNYSIRISNYQLDELRRISKFYNINISKILRFLLDYIINNSYIWSLKNYNKLDEDDLKRLCDIAKTKWLGD